MVIRINDIGIYCGEDFFFSLPSSPRFCLPLKKGLFYLGCTTCVSKTATSNIAQVQLRYHKHLLWFLRSFVHHDYFFLGPAGNALMFSIRGVLGLFEDYSFPLSCAGSEASAKVHVSVNQCVFQLTFFGGSLFCHFLLVFLCKLLLTYLDWINNRVTTITTLTAVEEFS